MNEVERVENGAVHEGLGEGARSGFTQAAWEEIRRAYGWPRTCFPLALFAAASWGTWDSFSDGAGDRLYGTFTLDRKSTRLNSSHVATAYAVFCLKKKR